MEKKISQHKSKIEISSDDALYRTLHSELVELVLDFLKENISESKMQHYMRGKWKNYSEVLLDKIFWDDKTRFTYQLGILSGAIRIISGVFPVFLKNHIKYIPLQPYVDEIIRMKWYEPQDIIKGDYLHHGISLLVPPIYSKKAKARLNPIDKADKKKVLIPENDHKSLKKIAKENRMPIDMVREILLREERGNRRWKIKTDERGEEIARYYSKFK
jgi:hypothetical protein